MRDYREYVFRGGVSLSPLEPQYLNVSAVRGFSYSTAFLLGSRVYFAG